MTKARADIAPAPLKALGGWPDAEWFCPSVLYDDEVVGFTLPKLQRGRKQSFRIVERSALPAIEGKPDAASRKMPKKVAAPGIADLIDEAGATNAAAFRRATFLFESAPVLYFARMPVSTLKIRAANKLRVALIESGFRGCCLHIDDTQVTAMFWPGAEVEISDYVCDADPPYAIHSDFDAARGNSGSGVAARGQDRLRDAEQARLKRTNTKLLAEVTALRLQVDGLRQSQSALGAMESLGLDDARLKSMLRLLHPDKHGNDAAANEAAKWINNLRDLLKTSRTLGG